MERHDLLALMTKLKLAGMRAAYDDIMRDGLKRQRSVQQILGDLLSAEVAEKQARSISYRIGAAKLPLAKELTEFEFTGSPVNEALVCDLHGGGLPRDTAQCRIRRGNRHRQKPSIDRHHHRSHTQAKRSGALLQRRRPGQPSGGRGSRRRRRQAGRATHPR